MDYFMNNKSATLYRMVMTDHMCPFGLKSKDLLQRQGYTVDDHHLTTREAVDEFKATHGVGTTPQTFINEVRIGGFDDLSEHFGKTTKEGGAITYQPVIALFAVLAQKWVRYGYVYPFVETAAGLLMLMGVLTWLSAPATLFIAGIGAISVIKAVYIDKRELKCACLGDSRVPLGFVSLVENLMMIGMALWMLA